MSSPLIILTNDDGIQSPGLRAVAQAVADLGELLIVAPRRQQTSMARAFHGRGIARAIVYRVNRRAVRAYDVPTSPAVTVRHAILLLADRAPALVISGINYGENIGSGVTISGTVGAALEAASLGVPAIAASIQTELKYHRTHSTAIDFSIAAQSTREFARRVLTRGLPRGVDVLNVNVPAGSTKTTPWRWTRISRLSYFRSTVAETRRGKRFTGYELNVDRGLVELDSDIHALLYDRVVSVSPMTYDLTARVTARALNKWGV
ncbi:MAG: 5'/3'-nucleotidase SurE [Chloroflexi bacterium]|nr:5'/3'-nucleotidase SurE [Chloroflexota bacterium]